MKEFTKALDIALHLESLADRELDPDDRVFLAGAYIWAAPELPPEQDSKRISYYNKSLPLLQAAMVDSPRDPNIPYLLASALDSLERYEEAIDFLRVSVTIESKMTPAPPDDKAITPHAKQNIASALVKLHKYHQALAELQSIKPGNWWLTITTDEDFSKASDATFVESFTNLCKEKTDQVPQSQSQ